MKNIFEISKVERQSCLLKRPAKGLFQRGKYWGVEYYARGKRIRQMIGTSKRLALDVLQKRRVALAENRYLDVKKEKSVKLFDFIKEFTELHAKGKKSFESYFEVSFKSLKAFFGDVYLRDISMKRVEQYRDEQRKAGLSEGTVNRRLGCLKSIFNRAIDWDVADTNPVRKVKFKKENNWRYRYLEEEELSKLLENSSPRLKALIKFALNTGMRKGEIQKLKWKDVDIARWTVTAVDTKNGETRHIPMNQTVRDLLIAVPRHKTSPYVFGGLKNGLPYNFRRAFATALKRSGIGDFRFHDLRHSFASYLAMKGVDLNTIRELMGHKTIQMTLRYSHLSKDHKTRAVACLDGAVASTAQMQEPEWKNEPIKNSNQP